MKKSKKLLKELNIENLTSVNGGNYGASLIWNEIVSALNPWGSCAWPGGFYSKPTPPPSFTCTSK
ncbi:hypothetical protein KCL53_001979 [Clostridium perfringens]|jgi:hypothetical protein|uniref:Bacteriocin n=1 Tax=Clostridium perfringens TaxID=1502 RepID=A0A2X3IHM0_CLOPF|nr:hypothetical protein [Clostridium perfringens]EHK2348852.1 hypothetical protein [Clostridium perfringens]EHK2389351.1 hypothetical protein [Clostridium perfringens]EIF2808644.1 hypothetical protein [Clostridium perfringens]EJT5935198.1 hypothetical protein [Clostridium perfringens]EJT6503050.1 hypothetical protein [Clostridium perfringens]